MPNILEGLEGEEFGTPPETDDVNTDTGFEAALRRAVEGQGGEQPSPESGEAERVPERGEGGRFVAPTPPEGEAQPTGEEQEGEGEQPTLDSDLQALIERHGGDRDAALLDLHEQHRNAQQTIGRQGGELGEARKLREEFDALKAQLTTRQPEPQPFVPFAPDERELERLEEIAAEHGGRAAVIAAHNAGRMDLVQEGFRIWGEEDPREAALAQFRYEQALTTPAPAAQQPPADPYVEQLKARDFLAETVAEVIATIPEANRQIVFDNMLPAMEDIGPRTKAMIESADPEERREGVKIVALAAQQRASATLTTQASKTEAERRAEAKRVAALGGGSLRPAAPAEGESEDTPEDRQKRLDEFHRRLQAAETTSVAEGLTGL